MNAMFWYLLAGLITTAVIAGVYCLYRYQQKKPALWWIHFLWQFPAGAISALIYFRSHYPSMDYPHHWDLVIQAALATCIVMVIAYSIYQRRIGKPTPWWLRFVWEFPLGGLVAMLSWHWFSSTNGAEPDFGPKEFAGGLIHALFLVILIELVRNAASLEEVKAELKSLDDRVTHDERVIFARTDGLERNREVFVIGVERLDGTLLPAPLDPPTIPLPPRNGRDNLSKEKQQDKDATDPAKWTVTISLLTLDRFQDVLFSTKYLEHFLKIHKAAEKQYRILVINDQPRSEIAIRSFLQMSDTLGIDTYVHLKSEFNDVLNSLRQRRPDAEGAVLRQIMVGQPELSIRYEQIAGSEGPKPVGLKTLEDAVDLKLRYRDRRLLELGKTDLRIDRGENILRLLRAALGDDTRLGLRHLERVIGGSSNRVWSCPDLVVRYDSPVPPMPRPGDGLDPTLL